MLYDYRGHGIQLSDYGVRIWQQGNFLAEFATEKEAREWINNRVDN